MPMCTTKKNLKSRDAENLTVTLKIVSAEWKIVVLSTGRVNYKGTVASVLEYCQTLSLRIVHRYRPD